MTEVTGESKRSSLRKIDGTWLQTLYVIRGYDNEAAIAVYYCK